MSTCTATSIIPTLNTYSNPKPSRNLSTLTDPKRYMKDTLDFRSVPEPWQALSRPKWDHPPHVTETAIRLAHPLGGASLIELTSNTDRSSSFGPPDSTRHICHFSCMSSCELREIENPPAAFLLRPPHVECSQRYWEHHAKSELGLCIEPTSASPTGSPSPTRTTMLASSLSPTTTPRKTTTAKPTPPISMSPTPTPTSAAKSAPAVSKRNREPTLEELASFFKAHADAYALLGTLGIIDRDCSIKKRGATISYSDSFKLGQGTANVPSVFEQLVDWGILSPNTTNARLRV